LRRAADEGDVRGKCGRALERGEPVFRQRYGRDWLPYDRWGGAVPVCSGCVLKGPWWHASSCDGYGRPVHVEVLASGARHSGKITP
jgi:hypothetical protein